MKIKWDLYATFPGNIGDVQRLLASPMNLRKYKRNEVFFLYFFNNLIDENK